MIFVISRYVSVWPTEKPLFVLWLCDRNNRRINLINLHKSVLLLYKVKMLHADTWHNTVIGAVYNKEKREKVQRLYDGIPVHKPYRVSVFTRKPYTVLK